MVSTRSTLRSTRKSAALLAFRDRFGLIDALARELQLHVLSFLEDWHDIGALLLALPPLGLDVLRSYPPEYTQEPLLSIAMALHRKEDVLCESLLRRYACDRRASEDGCEWLTRAVAAAGKDCCIVVEHLGGAYAGGSYAYRVGPIGRAAVVRCLMSGGQGFYEGEHDAERIVRVEHADGQKDFYEEGRKVRIELPGGSKDFFEGERGAERKVRSEFPNGQRLFFEGERGAERFVRLERVDGVQAFYEGERGAERKVRVEFPSGQKQFYEGEPGAERVVRLEREDGVQVFYEGEKGAERMVRVETPDGITMYFEGEQDAEQPVRALWPDGTSAPLSEFVVTRVLS